jgi:CDP-diacylglycerol---serine O-phosphatidyltransferase
MRPYFRLANFVTSVSLVAGFVALIAAPTRLALATTLVALAAVLDVVDGVIARRAGDDHTFGAQLDSLTDLLCFCVVPGFTLHDLARPDYSVLGAVIGSLVVLTGAWRLARYPLVHTETHFVGLPTPGAGCATMMLALWTPPGVVLAGAAVLALLMASSIRFPTLFTAFDSLRRRLPSGTG